MEAFRSKAILAFLCLYPIFSYVVVDRLDMDPNYAAGLFIYFLFVEVLFSKYIHHGSIKIPAYLIALGTFAVYVFASKIFITDEVLDTGIIRYLYRDPFLRSFCALFVLTNTSFDEKSLRYTIHFLFITLVVAALVSLRQVYDPLFFHNGILAGNFSSLDQYQTFMESLGPDPNYDITPLQEGYRYSIYSWISGISIGLDSMAIFSILMGIRYQSRIRQALIFISGGLVSFLSSSRWIMLNFFLILSQRLIGKPNPLFFSFKLLIGTILGFFIMVQVASYFGMDVRQFVQNRLLDDSAGTRIYAFKVFGEVFYQQPIFGTGGENTEKMLMLIQGKTSQIHVGWLKILYFHGIVGAALFLSFVALLLHHLYVFAKVNRYWGGFFAVLAYALANWTLVEFSFFYHGLLLAVIFGRHYKNEVTERASDLPQLIGKKKIRIMQLVVPK